jgi:hypothetical protein
MVGSKLLSGNMNNAYLPTSIPAVIILGIGGGYWFNRYFIGCVRILTIVPISQIIRGEVIAMNETRIRFANFVLENNNISIRNCGRISHFMSNGKTIASIHRFLIEYDLIE